MAKGFRIILATLAIVMPAILVAQSVNTYYQPHSLIKRLSYENFRNIKMLQTALMNYGGGDAEVETLVDEYAEASALYFQNKIEEAAQKFQDNERNILKAAQKVSKKYRDDTNEIFNNAIKMNVRNSIKQKMKSGDSDENVYADKYLSNAKFAFNQATDYYDRYINAQTANPRHLITAIFYYRQAKDNVFNMIQYSRFADDDQKNKDIIKEQLSKFGKDMVDNKNKVFESKEKQN